VTRDPGAHAETRPIPDERQATKPRSVTGTASEGMTWRNSAACLDEDPELFFPTGNSGPAFVQIEAAKVICHRCEVIDRCLEWAIEFGQDAGVWGGLSADERRALKRRTARARRTA
jgi:WhiB family transcriptional regulator, redox-sensing transcriptional regulator